MVLNETRSQNRGVIILETIRRTRGYSSVTIAGQESREQERYTRRYRDREEGRTRERSGQGGKVVTKGKGVR